MLELGVSYATLQCAELLARGAPGIHFCTLNRSPATRAILSALSCSSRGCGAKSCGSDSATALRQLVSSGGDDRQSMGERRAARAPHSARRPRRCAYRSRSPRRRQTRPRSPSLPRDQLALEEQLPAGDAVVAPELLAHAVDVDLEGMAHPCRQRTRQYARRVTPPPGRCAAMTGRPRRPGRRVGACGRAGRPRRESPARAAARNMAALSGSTSSLQRASPQRSEQPGRRPAPGPALPRPSPPPRGRDPHAQLAARVLPVDVVTLTWPRHTSESPAHTVRVARDAGRPVGVLGFGAAAQRGPAGRPARTGAGASGGRPRRRSVPRGCRARRRRAVARARPRAAPRAAATWACRQRTVPCCPRARRHCAARRRAGHRLPHPPLDPGAPGAGQRRRRHGASRSCCRAAPPSGRPPRRSVSCAPGSSAGCANWRRAGDDASARRHGALPRPDLDLLPQAGRTRVHRRGDTLLVPDWRRAPARARALVPPRRARRGRGAARCRLRGELGCATPA